jgi:hypothetical protein
MEAGSAGAGADNIGVLGLAHAAAGYGVDGDVELGIPGQPLELAVGNAQAFPGRAVGLEVIDADL